MNDSVDLIIGASSGALGTGLIGLLFFFVKRYFTNKEESHKEVKDKLDVAKLDIVSLQVRLDEQSKMLLELRDDVKFLIKQMAKVFTYIDAPPRPTDAMQQRR